MKLSNSVVYAVVTLAHIAQSDVLVLSKDISKKYNIQIDYLLKIMNHLSRARILKSKRGPSGGFSLARPAAKISLLEIYEAIEGLVNNNIAVAETAPKDKFSKKADAVFNKALGESKKVLKQTKLSDLL